MGYIGSKVQLLDFLYRTITKETKLKNSKDMVFCDLFAGTGSVGEHFNKKGFSIIANDMQQYSYVINSAKLLKNNVDISMIEKINNLKTDKIGFITKNYCNYNENERTYFTVENGKKIDTIREYIENLFITKQINKNDYNYLLYLLLKATDKVANTVSIYGAYLKNFKKSALKGLKFEYIKTSGDDNNIVYKEDAGKLIKKIKGDILYLDPPYNTRQYAANYHMLDTIALNDNPQIKGKTGIRADYYKSPYSSKAKVYDELDELIKNANFKHIFLSYNDEGILSIKDIENMFKKHGEYKLFKQENYKRYKSNSKVNNIKDTTVEYLHYLKKN